MAQEATIFLPNSQCCELRLNTDDKAFADCRHPSSGLPERARALLERAGPGPEEPKESDWAREEINQELPMDHVGWKLTKATFYRSKLKYVSYPNLKSRYCRMQAL